MSTDTTTQVDSPKLNEPQKAAQNAAVTLINGQIAALQKQQGLQNLNYDATAPLIPGQTAQLTQMQRTAEANQNNYNTNLAPIQAGALQREVSNAAGGNAVTPQQQALIDEQTNRQLALGQSNISAQAQDALNQLRDTLAPSRGLNPSDSPILDRGDLIGQASVRSYSDLVNSLRGNAANQGLQYPLQANQLTSSQDQYLGNFAANQNQFAQSLADAAYQNRLRLTGQTSSQGLGLATGSGGGALPALTSTISSGGQSTTSSGLGSALSSGGSIIGGLGGLLSGIGAL